MTRTAGSSSWTAQKTELEQIKLQVEAFEKQKQVLQQRVGTIEQLQRDRTGGQEFLDEIANTVSRAENLWLTTMSKKGSTITMDGAAASINSVANFITALKRSGYFQKIEIKDAKQDDKNAGVQTFNFTITAEIAPSGPRRTEHRKRNQRVRRQRQRQARRHRRRKDNDRSWLILSETCR